MASHEVRADPWLRVGTGWLLWGGIVGTVGFVVAFLVEGFARSGYDPVRLQVSYLSLGDGGWIQVASFLICGVLVIGFAVGVRRALGRGLGTTGVPIALGVAGGGLVIAGVFSTMPAFGYPPGTPPGFPSEVVATAYLHVVGAMCFFGGLVAAPLLTVRRLRADGDSGGALASVAIAVLVLVFFAASSADSSGRPFFPAIAGLLQRVSIIAGLGWVSAFGLWLLGRPRWALP